VPGTEIFCAELERIVAAAAEDVPFASLERSAAAAPRLGFPSGCGADGAGRHRTLLRSQRFAPDTLGIQSLVARTAACLPEAEHVIFATWRETMFRLPRATEGRRAGGACGADGQLFGGGV
jgi:hypothetical protein